MTSELIRMGPRWAAAAAGAILFCAVVVAKPAGPLPKWLPDGKYTARLAPVFRVGTHTVRPPAGYTLVTNELTGGAGSQYSWIGPRRLDDSHANFQMHVIHIPPEEQSQKALESAVMAVADGFRRGFPVGDDWTHTPAERGKINGFEFVRIYWKAPSDQLKTNFHGFVYGTFQGADFIVMAAADYDAFSKDSLGLAEAAARTFR